MPEPEPQAWSGFLEAIAGWPIWLAPLVSRRPGRGPVRLLSPLGGDIKLHLRGPKAARKTRAKARLKRGKAVKRASAVQPSPIA